MCWVELGCDNTFGLQCCKYIFLGGGVGDPFFLHKSSSRVDLRLHSKNQLPRYYGSCLKVSGWGGVGDRPITLSFQLELCWVELGCDN